MSKFTSHGVYACACLSLQVIVCMLVHV